MVRFLSLIGTLLSRLAAIFTLLLIGLLAVPRPAHADNCGTCGQAPTPGDYISNATGSINTLVNTGTLNNGQGMSLLVKLNASLTNLTSDPSTTVSQLQAFIHQVNAYLRAGLLTKIEAQPLIDAANNAIALIRQ